MRFALRTVAIVVPCFVMLVALIEGGRHGARYLLGGAVLLVFALRISIFLYRRSNGLEASLFYAKAGVGNLPPGDDPVDLFVVALGFVLVGIQAFSVLFP